MFPDGASCDALEEGRGLRAGIECLLNVWRLHNFTCWNMFARAFNQTNRLEAAENINVALNLQDVPHFGTIFKILHPKPSSTSDQQDKRAAPV